MPKPVLNERFSAGEIRIELTGRESENQLELEFRIDSKADCRLHWGLSRRHDKTWHAPPEQYWPPTTTPVDQHAVQSSCQMTDQAQRVLRIRLDLPCGWDSLPFVLYLPAEKRWLKNGRDDFRIPLPGGEESPSPSRMLAAQSPADEWQVREFNLGAGDTLAVALRQGDEETVLRLACDTEGPLLLHWGLTGRFRHQWQLPAAELRPLDTTAFDNNAVHTPFIERDGLRWLELKFPRTAGAETPRGINFLLYQPGIDRWLKADGRDINLPLAPEVAGEGLFPSARAQELAEQIIDAEMNRGSWTLMHRFNLCHDLLDGIEEDSDALALLYAWLRFSAIRQLDWQRNYNTQPRELSHSQERLTLRLADLYKHHPSSRPWLRLMLSTLGRGGEGQKVRDEILNIMHRHHIKEVHGHFMEEWHQKLHNNTTPDDVVICEAYLAFLNSNGDLGQFYDTLSRGGVSRERLQGFERPIHTDPEFYPDKRDGLSRDFEHFLRVLKSVHSGTDLDTAAGAVRGVLEQHLDIQLNTLYDLRQQGASLIDQVKTITALRESLTDAVPRQEDTRAIREMLYLDLALEQLLRSAIEQQHADNRIRVLTDLVVQVLRNLALDRKDQEFPLCARHLQSLLERFDDTIDWALHAKSVTDRAGRAVARWSETLYTLLQPKAEYLGEAFTADQWTIPLFSEEVIRGGAGFMLSLLLRRLDPLLRQRAGLGGWQVISPAQAAGVVQVVKSLRSVQGDTFSGPTVLVTDAVAGDEEIPAGITSVITSDAPDLVSHVAVRARNARVLFATCYDGSHYDELKKLQGRQLALDVTPSGDVAYQERTEARSTETREEARTPTLRRRQFSSWVVGQEVFNDEIVGAKSNNLQSLRGRLSDWIQFPASIALPFGVFERTLASSENQSLKEQLNPLLQQASQAPESHLPQVRQLLQQLVAPEPLRDALLQIWAKTVLQQTDWSLIWEGIKKVWASKWNERAWYSRTARAIPHDDLMMAVLIQQVVEANYAFVIHTVNPITGRDDELFAEVVPGLGETLVGNYPGRALGFVCAKTDLELTILSYPGKSLGLYGSGVIFRSDSNGEDLEGFAGAGLYDSFLAQPPQERLLDYASEPLVWDQTIRDEMLRMIARIGLEVEQACGSAQDIEGAIQGNDYFLVQTRPQVGL